jgi:hypothetical protein
MKIAHAAPPEVLRVDEKDLREYDVFNDWGVVITTNYKTNGIYAPFVLPPQSAILCPASHLAGTLRG